MRAVWAAALLLRRLRADAGILLLLFLLVASTSFLFAAAPRLLNNATDEAVQYAVAKASPVERDIWLYGDGSIAPGKDGGVSAAEAYGEEREAAFPASIEQLISNRYLGITTVRLAVQQPAAGAPTFLSLRYQDGVTQSGRLVSGRWPVDRHMPLLQSHLGQQTNAGDQATPTIFEAALSTTQAKAIGAHVGDFLSVSLDHTDPLLPRSAFGIAPTQVEVVGLYQPVDSGAADLLGASGLLQPTVRYGPAGIAAIYATAFVGAGTYPGLAAGGLPFRYDWRFQIDPARLDAGQVDTLQADLRHLDVIATTSAVGLTAVSTRSGLLPILEQVAAQRAQSESVLSIAALGPLGLAASAIAMFAFLLVRRRRAGLLLARGRGASGTLLLGAQAWEAVLLAGSGALAGLLLAVLAVPARDAPLSSMLAAAVAAGTTILMVAATWRTARHPLGQLERDDPAVFRVSPRRLAVETTIVGSALVAVVLLEQRGLTLGPAGPDTSFDPLLAAVPLLTGLAAGIIAMRLYPLPIRALGWLAGRRPDFVPALGLRTVARRPASANMALLVVTLTAAFGSFASVVATSIDGGQVAASYLAVGADYRIEDAGTSGLPSSFNPGTVSGVAAVASGVIHPAAAFASKTNQRATIDLVALDPGPYARVTAGTAAQPDWPTAFLVPPFGAAIGSETDPIPAILSSQLPPGSASLGPGDTFTVTIAQQPLTFRLVQQRASFPGLTAVTFAIVPLDWVRAATPGTAVIPTDMWLRASSQTGLPLAAMVNTAAEPMRIVSRADSYGLVHDAPLASAVANGFGLALGVAVLYLALTLVGGVIMSAAGRTRELSYLRSLGVSARQALALTAIEHGPLVLVALVPGVLLGVGVAMLVGPSLGLADFVGGQGIPLFVDWPTLALVVLALGAIVAAAILIGTWLARRGRLVSALRIEETWG